MDLVLRQFLKVLSGLRRIRHIIIEETHRPVLLIRLEHLPARRKILKDNLLLPFLHHRKVVKILDAGFPVLADDIDHLKILCVPLSCLLAPSHHHPGKYIACPAVQHPFHKDKRRLIRGKITLERPVFCIPVSLMHERSCQHLDKHGFTASVPKGQKRTLAVQMKALVADTDRIVIIIYIDQPDRLNLAHTSITPFADQTCSVLLILYPQYTQHPVIIILVQQVPIHKII